MNLPSTIEVVITPRDVLTSRFGSLSDCAFAKAVKRKVKTEDVRVGTTIVIINNVEYKSDVPFECCDFHELRARAENGERFKIKKTLTRQV